MAFRRTVQMRTPAMRAVEDEVAHAVDRLFTAGHGLSIEVEHANVVDGELTELRT
jgi:hypothetical protein